MYVAQCPCCNSQNIVPHACSKAPEATDQIRFYCTVCANVLTLEELLYSFVSL